MSATRARPVPPQRMLLVDDDLAFRERLASALRKRGADVRVANDAESAVDIARAWQPTRAVVDLRMPGKGGLWLVEQLLAIKPAPAVVVLTGFGTIATATTAMRLGARDYRTKPIGADELLSAFAERPEPDGGSGEPSTPAPPSLAAVEWEYIQRVLDACDGNVSEAARLLGVHRRSLQRKLKKRPPPEGG
jgi:two-component system response regulator RegA